MDVQARWDRLLLSLEGALTSDELGVWFQHVEPVTFDLAQGLTLRVANRFYVDWIRDNYMGALEPAAADIVGGPVPVHLQIATEAEDVVDPKRGPGAGAPLPASRATGLHPQNTYETFVVGECNRLAHAAAEAVGDRPATLYNPLYIYGSTGLGKTHLMHALGNDIVRRYADARVVYVTAEEFTNEVISGIRFQRTEVFREKYREQATVLLVDDIQFLSGKARTQEEFFHTFNRLQAAGRQIVLASDVEPKDIEGLEPRLRTRFEGGLVVDMQPPDLETLLAILHRKADGAGLALPDDVANAIASVANGSVREIEGVVNRLGVLANLFHEPITLEFARKHLAKVFAPGPPTVTVAGIIEAVAKFHNLRSADITGQRRTRALTEPRHQAMYLARRHTKLSFPELGREFGDRDHSTIQHGVRKVEGEVPGNPDLATQIRIIEVSLGLRPH